MKVILALCFLFVYVYSTPTFNVQLDATWNLYKKTFEKEYYSNEEEIHRRLIWEDNIDFIRKHNLEADLGLHSYTVGMNKYGDMSNAEFNQQMNTLKPSFENQTEYIYETSDDVEIPNSIDWTQKGYVTGVKDQGQCGSCWAFSATGALEGQNYAKTRRLVSLSEQNLIDCSSKYGNHGCNGGSMIAAFQYVKENGGIDTEVSYPYETHDSSCRYNKRNSGGTDTGYVSVPAKSELALQTAIASKGPVSVAIDASRRSFQMYRSGVYDEPACSSTQLNHGVLAVGYGTNSGKACYKVKNSWGTSWGANGYVLMSRNKNNQCGIATWASYPTV